MAISLRLATSSFLKACVGEEAAASRQRHLRIPASSGRFHARAYTEARLKWQNIAGTLPPVSNQGPVRSNSHPSAVPEHPWNLREGARFEGFPARPPLTSQSQMWPEACLRTPPMRMRIVLSTALVALLGVSTLTAHRYMGSTRSHLHGTSIFHRYLHAALAPPADATASTASGRVLIKHNAQGKATTSACR